MKALGGVLYVQGDYARALDHYRQALAMEQKIYSNDEYPQGHPDLEISLNNVGVSLGAQGDYARAFDYHKQSLTMSQRLYPKETYPRGHTALVGGLANLGNVLQEQGEYARAVNYCRQAVAMGKRLLPEDQILQGHRILATALRNLAVVLKAQGDYATALDFYQQAQAMKKRLYPRAQYPQGHPVLAGALHDLGLIFQAQGDYPRAQEYCHKALAMRAQLYPRSNYPNGHPDLACTLHNLGSVLDDKGEYEPALAYFRKALAMGQRLYPKTTYPAGHPDLVNLLQGLGRLHHARAEHEAAFANLQKALAMRQTLTDTFLAAASEAEANSHILSLPLLRDGLLSVARQLPNAQDTSYRYIWRGKAVVTRLLERRHQALVKALHAEQMTASDREKAQGLSQRLRDTRRALSRMLLTPANEPEIQRERLQQLSQEKVDLERELVRLLPDFARQQALERQGHDTLVKKLPSETVFIDLLRYTRCDQNPKRPGKAGQMQTVCYVAFVLTKDRPIQRVELGRAKLIEAALAAWRTEIQETNRSAAAHKLRRLIWEPLAKDVPSRTKMVLVAPDGALTRLPWAALPVNAEGRVLLEDYAVAVVPHGPFLLERLDDPASPAPEAGVLVALGAVQYDAMPQAAKGSESVTRNRAAEWGERKLAWKALPGTSREMDHVVAFAGRRPVHRLTGIEATTARLLVELPQARWVHIATHGFFADKKFRSFLQVDEKLFDRFAFHEGPAPGARNPLVLSGLVLAGANMPLPTDLAERTRSDGGILTAEAIAGLPLHNLDLAVLSACETGLGEVAGGEGVFGLQRAFHLAGARNVVASLWKVDDQATAALMALFYDKLWRQNKPAIVALREAQLTLYHHPERIAVLAKERGPNFDKVVRLPAAPKEGKKPDLSGKPSTKLWAGFVLSGLGR
jgi:CHAT domain-containing protein